MFLINLSFKIFILQIVVNLKLRVFNTITEYRLQRKAMLNTPILVKLSTDIYNNTIKLQNLQHYFEECYTLKTKLL